MKVLTFKKENYNGQPVIIYGAGLYGEVTLRGLQFWGIEPVAFIDRNDNITEYLNKKVIHPENIKDINDFIILIASKSYFRDMIDELNKLKVEICYDVSAVLDIKDIKDRLSEYAREVWYNHESYLETAKNYNNKIIIINNIDLVITEYCNLNCRGCGSLIPYYKKASHMKIDELILYFNRFLNCIDQLNELRILGGETFLYPSLNELIDYYKENEKIKKIILYTNSTFIPELSVIKKLSHDKIIVHMSNYGKVSKAIDGLQKIFEEYDVNYFIHEYSDWRDMGEFVKYNYSEEQVKKIIDDCINKQCNTFLKGKIYICPRAAHGENLGFFQNKKEQCVDFTCEDYDKEYMREKIKKVLFEKNIFNACYYCKGNSIRGKKIPAAIQMDKNERVY